MFDLLDKAGHSSDMFCSVYPWLVLSVGLVSCRFKMHRDVMTTQGVVRGYFDPMPPRYTYLGIPYARPPTRLDRFKAPKPPQQWDGIFEATYRVKCPQKSSGDENCLVVNIYTPENGTSLPVLVHVHGGGFQNGWGPHKPPIRLIKMDIIIVTFNYRLGALGFLCVGIPEASGNAGLKDQIAALYWIQRNIAKFGGNPLDITLYGTEAGAVSVEILLLSKLTKSLFHKVILESGSVLSPLSVVYDPFLRAIEIAINLGYKGPKESLQLTKFFQNIPARNLSEISDIFVPCIETVSYYSHSILDADPLKILNSGNFDKVPILIIYTDFTIKDVIFNKVKSFDDLLPSNLKFDSFETKYRVAELVKEFYFDYEDDDMENLSQRYANYIQDVSIEYPIVKTTYLHAAKGFQPVYLMKFLKNAHIKTDVENIYDNIADFIYSSDNLSENIEIIVDILVTFWTNFIKFSDPTPLTTSLIPVIWQPVYIEEHRHKANLDSLSQQIFGKTLSMSKPSTHQQMIFWDRIYEKFYKPHS